MGRIAIRGRVIARPVAALLVLVTATAAAAVVDPPPQKRARPTPTPATANPTPPPPVPTPASTPTPSPSTVPPPAAAPASATATGSASAPTAAPATVPTPVAVPAPAPPPSPTSEEDELSLLFAATEVVTASKAPEPAALAPASITVITADEIRRMGARDLSDVLRTVVGIELTRDQFGAVQIVSRGILSPSESNQILLLLDGVPANIPYYGGASLVYDDLALAGIKRIEVIRGPGSALYGAAAFAGVVQVVTRDPDDLQGVEAVVGGGSYPAAHASLVAGHVFDADHAVQFRADFLTSDGPRVELRRDAFSGVVGPDGEVSDAPGTVPSFKEKVHLGLNAKLGNETTLHASFLRSLRGVWLGNYILVSDVHRYEQIDAYARLAWGKTAVGDRLRLDGAVTVQQHNEREIQQILPAKRFDLDGDGDVEDLRNKTPLDIGDLASDSFSVDLQASWKLAERHVLLGGLGYQAIDQTDTFFFENWDENGYTHGRFDLPFNSPVTRQITGVFLNDDWTVAAGLPFLHRLRILAGIRYDYYDDDVAKKETFGDGRHFDAVAPRAGLVWELRPGLYAKYLYGSAFRAPTFRELYSNDPNSIVGAGNLEPETIQFHEVSVGLASPKLQTQVTAFRGRATELIGLRNEGTTIFLGNFGRLSTDGVEAELRAATVLDAWVFGNATIQEVRLVDRDQASPGVTRVKGNVGLSLPVVSWAHLATSLTYVGRRLQPDFADEGDDRYLPAYLYAAAAVTLKTPWKWAEAQIAGFNLLGAGIRDPFDGPALPDEIPGESASVWAHARFTY